MKAIVLVIVLLVGYPAKAQHIFSADTMQAPIEFDNTYAKSLGSDSLSSTSVIWIKKELKPHKHTIHSEFVYIMAGEADMRIGEMWGKVKKGDVVFIPKGMVHAVKVTSSMPLKVLSTQSPFADGTDRVYVNE